ncbi:MHYT domain-containing protein [Massilia endophytica]|uniref:MHYT domain-containing protein n=1 Tax=Massilia endophytica TaxID=2899220 RepID=UPI001E4CE0DE|nr:MHYT domain-containing protein [Massilia endophytica]UGQ48709.1 ATP-binding protein [Massilia endophytica]
MLIGRYDPSLVLISIAVAIFASYTALSLAGRVRQSSGSSVHAWTIGGAFAMGSGIWAMHFVGMLAFELPIPVGYDMALTLLSLLLPIVVSALALQQMNGMTLGPRRLFFSAGLMGLGIAAMHYTGMAAMHMQPVIDYDPLLFATSIAIAIVASAGAIWTGNRLRESAPGARLAQAAAAVIMGFAIVGMHYTGMAAANFPAGSVCLAAGSGMNQDHLAILVTVATVCVLSVALLVSIFDARLETRNRQLSATAATAEERRALYLHELEARVEAERLSHLKDEFLAIVSHELRTPLNAILGWSQLLLQQDGQDKDSLRKGVLTIERNARAQAQLIDDLLEMSKIISGKVRLQLKPCWPGDFIGAAVDTVRPTAMAKRIRLDVDLDKRAGPVLCDPSRMQQVMWNLLSNAVKFTEPGGMVCVRLYREGRGIGIEVRDTGIGIRADFLPFVFERFRQADASTTRRHGGLGLGLAIARQLVEMQGGTIGVTSQGEGRGATFSLTLPEQAPLPDWHVSRFPAEGAGHKAESAPMPDLAGLKILVLDDEADSLELVREILAQTGATILCAHQPLEALDMLAEFRPHLLISDIGMPGMDGFELIRRVRALEDGAAASLPAIALSAFARREDRSRALANGFTDYLVKPVTPALLRQAVARALRRESAAGAGK